MITAINTTKMKLTFDALGCELIAFRFDFQWVLLCSHEMNYPWIIHLCMFCYYCALRFDQSTRWTELKVIWFTVSSIPFIHSPRKKKYSFAQTNKKNLTDQTILYNNSFHVTPSEGKIVEHIRMPVSVCMSLRISVSWVIFFGINFHLLYALPT